MDAFLVYVSAAALVASGTLMALRVVGIHRGNPWTTWAPFIFGLAIVVGMAAFVHLLVSGIR